MNKWKCVMTAGITALFDGCMLRCLITGAPAQKKGKMQYIGLAVGTVLCLTGLLAGGRTIYQVAGEKTPGTGGTDKLLKNADELDK